MKKVLLVDDEILVRESIRECIDWEKEGFFYCGDASDGELALPLIEQYEPDILITDIKMPFMNGLELSTIVRSTMPAIKIIILSGHDEFEYARAALRIGVEDYCLKPVSSSDIVRMLQMISERIDHERYEQERMLKLQLLKSESTELSQHKLLSDLCNGLITTAEAIQLASQKSLSLTANYYVAVVTDIRSPDGYVKHDIGFLQSAEKQLEIEMQLIGDFLSYKRSHNETVWLFKGSTIEELELILQAIIDELYLKVEAACHCMLSVGNGSIQDRLQGIHISYLEADDDKHWRRLARRSHLNLIQAAASLNSSEPPASASERQRFIEFLKLGTEQHTGSFVESFAKSLHAIDWKQSLYGCHLLHDLTIETFQLARSLSRDLHIPSDTVHRFQRELDNIRCLDEAGHYTTRLIEQFWHWRQASTDKYAEMLYQVKSYIQNHYINDRLSLQEAAEYVNVSPSHLSKIFSQETGQTFIEFLTQTRIVKAMEMLRATNARSYEIAHMVGYNDSHYFSSLFKRVTGQTMTQFRKQAQSLSMEINIEGASHEKQEKTIL